MTQAQLMIAKESYVTTVNGVEETVIAGVTRVREGHQIMAGREDLFEPAPADYEIEEATAAPGRKRTGAKA